MEYYEPPSIPMNEMPEPVNIPLPRSLTPSPPQEPGSPVIPCPWNTTPPQDKILLPPIAPPMASSSCLPWVSPIQITPLPKYLLTEDEPLVNKEGPPSWAGSQPSPLMGKRQESPQHVTMPFKCERSDPVMEQSISSKEHPTPPNSPKAMAVLIPSSFGFTGLYATPTQTITEVDKEMEEGERTSSEQLFNSIDIGIPCIPSDWLQPSSP